MSGLPDGWATAQMDAVAAQIQYGYTATSSPEAEGPRYLRITDIQDGAVDWNAVPRTKMTAGQEKYELRIGDLVFARTGATVGKSFLISDDPGGAIFASYLIRLSLLQGGLLPETAAAFFRSPGYWQQIFEGATGTGQPNFNGSKLAQLRVPIPPLAEQRRIVVKLDALSARTARARADLDRVPALAERQTRAVLAAACRGDLTRAWRAENGVRDFGVVPLSQLCVSITDGDHQAPPKATSGVPFITISAMNDGRLDLAKATRFVPRAYLDGLKPTRVAEVGDLLYSVTGSFGIPALVEVDAPFVFQRHIAILKPDLGRTTGKFLSLALAGADVLEQARVVATGTAQLTVPLNGLRSFRVPAPSLAEQAEIIRRVDAALSDIDRLVNEAAAARRLLDRLDQAILAKAFRGELVPQDPADEPASVLLDRIRAEQAAAPGQVRRGRRSATT